MKKKLKILIAIIVIIELAIILHLGLKYLEKYILSTASVVEISNENFSFQNMSEEVTGSAIGDFGKTEPLIGIFGKFGKIFGGHQPSWLPYIPEITINSDTLNERFDYTISKSNDTFRIITLGDSFTFGQYVHTKDNFSEVLEDLLNSQLHCNSPKLFEVINLGVGGYDIEYSVKRYINRGQKYDPDLILWLLLDNDFEQIKKYMDKRIYDYLLPLVNVNDNEVLNLGAIAEISGRNLQIEAYQQARKYFIEEFDKEILVKHQRTAINKIYDYYSNQLLVFTLPAGGFIDSVFKSIIHDFVNERDKTHFFESKLDLLENDGIFLLDGHPNIKGHRLIAEDLLTYLTKNNIIPCD